MTEQSSAAPVEYDEAAIARLQAFVEEVTGGRIVRMERQVRWRPAWFADVDRGGEILKLHLRGDRAGDVAIFPDLKREADIMSILYDNGIPVPRIHGYCQDPPCIVMDSLAGTRDVLDGTDEAQRTAIGREYMSAVAAMHKLPVAPFVAAGVHLPEGAEEIALVGLHAYLPHYRRTKSRPEPLLEFVIQWIRRNVPKHRTAARFVQFDSGQFLVENGKMTGLYDFEFSMIGDPMTDLATMAMRNSIEPLGRPFPELCRFYEEAVGEPLDHGAIRFHNLVFATLGTMQFTGTVGDPKAGDPHSVYLEWDLSLRRTILLAMAELMGVDLPQPDPVEAAAGDFPALIKALHDTISTIGTAEAIDESRKTQALELVEWLGHEDRMGDAARQRDIADISAYLGRGFDSIDAAQTALEAHVIVAEPTADNALFHLLATIEQRRMAVFGPTQIGQSARNVALVPTR
jgi:aminoglycoside phosphotransferase (APT) family kinase protein